MMIIFELNGQRLYTNDPKELLITCLTSVNFKWWSYDALAKYLKGTVESLQIFCRANIEENKKQPQDNKPFVISQRRYSLFVTWSNKLIKNLPKTQTDHLHQYTYNIILACDGLGLLHGFGLANKHGDKVKGNPELRSIYEIVPFESYVQTNS